MAYATVRLVRTDESWANIARELADEVAAALPDVVSAVEHIGSTAVPGMLAKPIIDLAIAVRPGTVVDEILEPMASLGWIYRGDAGPDGGWVFVLEDAPWHRVAHAHGVDAGGPQWTRYLVFRDLLRQSDEARTTYGLVKQRLADEHPEGRRGYTSGKDAAVKLLLAGSE